tara:strand:+ start:65 stop:199 length:135 start_codon:yes stop_codon:yes gene_type:complete
MPADVIVIGFANFIDLSMKPNLFANFKKILKKIKLKRISIIKRP